MSWIVLIVIILSVSINGQRILTPPKNYTGIIGESAEFKCHVELDIYQTVMSWEFNNDPVYIYQYGAIEYPKYREKYIGNHTKKRDTFTLAVMNLSHSDVGWYKCVVVSIEKSALLLVLDKPQIHIPNNNPVAGSKAQYICKAGFAGPSTENIALAQYPQLRMILDGNLLDGSIEEKTDSSGYHRQLTQVHEVKLEARMNRKIMICDLGTSSPPTHVNVTAEMMVLYPVRSITYTPKKGQCEIGTEIICTADGNPEPYFLWDNIENIGNSIEGPLMNITKQMIGENNWRCTATNALGGRSYQESVIAAFKVVGPGDIVTSSNDSWIIAVSVIISTFIIIIGCLIVLFCYCHLRKKHKPPDGMADINENMPMINKKTYSPGFKSQVPGLPVLTIVCGEDGKKWEEEIRKICEDVPRLEEGEGNAISRYAVQTYSSMERVDVKFKGFNNRTKKIDSEKLLIILSMGFKAHVKKYVDSLNSSPVWLPKATIIVDLPAQEIPDWFEKRNIEYIDTQKYDDIGMREKMYESLFGKELSKRVKADTPEVHGGGWEWVGSSLENSNIGSIAEGLAWAYFVNYINLIGPTMVERIRKFEEKEYIPSKSLPKKLFILLPSSCYSHPKLEDADPAMTPVGKLETFTHQIAGNKRDYGTAVYKFTVKGQTYYACVEYCTPVFVLYGMSVMGVISFSAMERTAELHNFYKLLQMILNLNISPQFCQDFKLVAYDDKGNFKISEILATHIQRLEEDKFDW